VVDEPPRRCVQQFGGWFVGGPCPDDSHRKNCQWTGPSPNPV
jgi:hypothetical protein